MHVDEVMAESVGVAGQAPAAPRLRLGPAAEAEHARLPLPGPEQREGDHAPATPASCPTRSRTARRWCSRASCTARRVRGRAGRRHGEVPVEVHAAGAARAGTLGSSRWPHSDRSSCSRPSWSRSYALGRVASPARGAAPRRLIDSGIGAFYLTAALMCVASAIIVHAFVTGDYAIKYVQHYSDSAQPLAYRITLVLGRPRRLDHVLGVPAVDVRHGRRRRQPRAAPRTDPLGRRDHRRDGDVLHLHHGGAQQSVRHLRDAGAGRRQGPQPAAAEFLHGDPSAVALYGLCRDDDSRTRSAWRRSSPATSTTRGCAPCGAGR